MTITTVSNLSGTAGRTFEIEVMGSPHQAMLRASNYAVKVPYSSLSQTIRAIGQRGGKVINVKMLGNLPTEVESVTKVEPVAPSAPVVEATPTPPQAKTKAADPPTPTSRRQQSKSKKR